MKNEKKRLIGMVNENASIGTRQDGDMGDYTKPKNFAYIREVKDMEAPNTNQLRVYCDSVSAKSFNVQIRTHAPITDLGRKGSVARDMIAGITLTVGEMEELISYMKAVLAQHEPKAAKAAPSIKTYEHGELSTHSPETCKACAQFAKDTQAPAQEAPAFSSASFTKEEVIMVSHALAHTYLNSKDQETEYKAYLLMQRLSGEKAAAKAAPSGEVA
jgi:hypothetical protein